MKGTSGGKVWQAGILGVIILLCSVNAFAEDRGGHGRGRVGREHDFRGRPHEVVSMGHNRYHYRDGSFFRLGWFGLEFAVVTPPMGAIITVLPSGYRAVAVNGATYYSYNNIYYQPCNSGYVVVPQPLERTVAIPENRVLASGNLTINIPNANGSYTSIMLVKKDNGYIGPQGEYYPQHPTVEQLKALYGK